MAIVVLGIDRRRRQSGGGLLRSIHVSVRIWQQRLSALSPRLVLVQRLRPHEPLADVGWRRFSRPAMECVGTVRPFAPKLAGCFYVDRLDERKILDGAHRDQSAAWRSTV